MSISNIDAIKAYASQAKKAITDEAGKASGAVAGPGSVSGESGGGFGEELKAVIDKAVESGKASEQKAAESLVGKTDVVDVVTAISAAEVTLQTVVAVRDRVIGAYQEIMRMPI